MNLSVVVGALSGDTDISPHAKWTPVLLSEALRAHNVYVCLERPSGALPPDPAGPAESPPQTVTPES